MPQSGLYGKGLLAAASVLIQLPPRYANRSTCLTGSASGARRSCFIKLLESDEKSTHEQGGSRLSLKLESEVRRMLKSDTRDTRFSDGTRN